MHATPPFRRLQLYLFSNCFICVNPGNTLHILHQHQVQLSLWAEQFFDRFMGHVYGLHVLQLLYSQVDWLYRYNLFHIAQKIGSCFVLACVSSCCGVGSGIHLCTLCNRFCDHIPCIIYSTLKHSLFPIGGQGILLGYLNTFVHAVMYTYYLLSIWKPEIKSSISIKKNITRLQMVKYGCNLSGFAFFPSQ